jgi:hypothetical protein
VITLEIPAGAEWTILSSMGVEIVHSGRLRAKGGRPSHAMAHSPKAWADAIAHMLLDASAEDRVAFLRALAPHMKHVDQMLADVLAAQK